MTETTNPENRPIPTQPTPEMIEAGISVDWVQDHFLEFGLEDDEAAQRELVARLWLAMAIKAPR